MMNENEALIKIMRAIVLFIKTRNAERCGTLNSAKTLLHNSLDQFNLMGSHHIISQSKRGKLHAKCI